MKKTKICCRILMVMLILCASVILPVKVMANESTYRLEELELEMTIPSGYTAITRDTPANDPIFNEIGMLQSDFVSVMENGSIYMEIFPKDFTEEIVVTMQPNDFPDFNTLSDNNLSLLADKLVDIDMNSEYGYDMKYFDYKLYEHSQTKFIVEYFTDSTNSVYGLQYYTIYNDKAMNFTLRSYAGPISETQEKWMKKLVDNVKFDSEYVNFGHSQEIEGSIFTDAKTGIKFSVPENWVEEEGEFLNAKFSYTLDVGIFGFSAADMWEQMSESEKFGYERSDINNDLFPMDLIEAMFTATHGVTPEEIYRVTYNGMEYYEGVVTKNLESEGVTTEAEFTILYRFDNGWVYMFDFGVRKGADLHNDFEQIMNSVQYPENAGTISAETPKGNAILLVTFIALLILAMVVIVLKLNRNKQSNNTPFEYNPLMPNNNLESANEEQEAVFCRNCGKALPKDSVFCHHCGTRIIE